MTETPALDRIWRDGLNRLATQPIEPRDPKPAISQRISRHRRHHRFRALTIVVLLGCIVGASIGISQNHYHYHYRATLIMLLLRPATTPGRGAVNPYLTQGLPSTAEVLSSAGVSRAIAQQVIATGAAAHFSVTPDHASPLVTIAATSTRPQQAEMTVSLVAELLTRFLAKMQEDVAAPPKSFIRLDTLEVRPVVRLPDRTRTVEYAAIIVPILALALILTRSLQHRREQRHANTARIEPTDQAARTQTANRPAVSNGDI